MRKILSTFVVVIAAHLQIEDRQKYGGLFKIVKGANSVV